MANEAIKVDILGVSFSIQTDESPEYMREILDRLSRKVESVRSTSKVSDPLKLAVLTGIYLVDELMKPKDASKGQGRTSETQVEEARENFEILEITSRLIDSLDGAIGETERTSGKTIHADPESFETEKS